MALRRRGLLGCMVLAVVFVLAAPLLFWGEIPLLGLSKTSLAEVGFPEWVNGLNPFSSALKSQTEGGVKEMRVFGPNDVGVETTIPSSAYTQGITVLDNLYLRNGTLVILTPDRSKFPLEATIIGKPMSGLGLDSAIPDLQFLHPSTEILGQRAIRITGLSVIITDAPSSMNNFYSWWAEIVLGAWRIYSKLGAEQRTLSLPSRFILPAVADGEWRDGSKMTGPLMRVAFPSTAIQQADYWKDLMTLERTVIFDRVILVSREAATQSSNAAFWSVMGQSTSGATQSPSGGVRPDFWEPIRQTVVRNTAGCVPDPRDVVLGQVRVAGYRKNRPLVTYLSSQHSNSTSSATPRMDEDDHEGLIDALRGLERAKVCDLRVVDVERASLAELVEYAAKSTILVGVRGIGMTHQLWMPPSRRSTVVEIMSLSVENTYDQAVVAGILGHQHYAVWNDTVMTTPEGSYDKENDLVESGEELFGSDTISVYGPAVARLIKDRLSL